MEKTIFEMIINTGGLALVIAILFYYSLKSYQSNLTERLQQRKELSDLQSQFHSFKNDIIEKLIELSTETKLSVDKLSDSIEKNLKCRA